MKAAGYLRVSGKSQVEGGGFPRQQSAVQAFCDAHKITLLECVQEEGVSGTVEGLDRPGFSGLLLRDDISAIVVERADRLARDLIVGELLLRECRARDIKVFAADRGTLTDLASDETEPTQTLIRQILGALAQWEKTMLVKKLRASRDRIKATGAQCEGRKPYGSHPGEQFVMAQILDLRKRVEEDKWGCEHPLSYNRIAGILNEMGMQNRSGKPWKEQNVRTILRNNNSNQTKKD